MTLFGFGKKKEKEINAPVCTCNGNCSVSETVEPENLNNCCQDIQGRICCIKVLGSGCCHALYENTQSAVKAMGISVEVEYITDLKMGRKLCKSELAPLYLRRVQKNDCKLHHAIYRRRCP